MPLEGPTQESRAWKLEVYSSTRVLSTVADLHNSLEYEIKKELSSVEFHFLTCVTDVFNLGK